MGALAELQDEGKIRHIGVCNVMRNSCAGRSGVTPVVSVQNRYNLGRPDARRRGRPVRAGRRGVPALGAGGDAATPASPSSTLPGATAVGPRQVALAWLLARSPQILPIPGSGSPEHVEQNVERPRSIDLDPAEVLAQSPGPRQLPSLTMCRPPSLASMGHA